MDSILSKCLAFSPVDQNDTFIKVFVLGFAAAYVGYGGAAAYAQLQPCMPKVLACAAPYSIHAVPPPWHGQP